MCPAIKNLFYQCKKLKQAGRIFQYSFGNGSLRIKINENDTRKHTIWHVSDLTKATGLSKQGIESIVAGEQMPTENSSPISRP